jgi:hypothetical protein
VINNKERKNKILEENKICLSTQHEKSTQRTDFKTEKKQLVRSSCAESDK